VNWMDFEKKKIEVRLIFNINDEMAHELVRCFENRSDTLVYFGKCGFSLGRSIELTNVFYSDEMAYHRSRGLDPVTFSLMTQGVKRE
jgi:hypothetical protein